MIRAAVAHWLRTAFLGVLTAGLLTSLATAAPPSSALSGERVQAEPQTSPAADQEAFPIESKKGKAVRKPGKNSGKKDRITRRVKEPMVPRAPVRKSEEPVAPLRLPEALGPARAPRSVGQAGGERSPLSVGTGGGIESPLSDDFAPYGRMVKCELVFTVDSINLNTPIVGLVSEDVWWNGNLIVPAGTEVFGKAVPDRVGNRIGDEGKWTLVLPQQEDRINGRELILKGFALDRAERAVEPQGRVRSWSVSDGSAGLQGYVIDEADRDKIQLFLATALAGAVDGLAGGLQTRIAAAGNAGLRGASLVPSTLRNAGLSAAAKGANDSLEVLARQILEEIQKNGAYVRVPAGKTFYLFIDQTVDPNRAAVGERLMGK